MKPIDIVITCWKREWMTKDCIMAIKRNTNTAHRIILIDNGSDQEWQEHFVDLADIYVKLDKNYGLEYAKHIGMQFVESELFVSTDNDILVTPDWLSKLITLMEKYKDYAAIACRPQILVGTGMYMFETKDEVIPFHHVPGYARIMRTDIIRKTGAWEDKRPLRGHEELWIGDRLDYEGWKMGWAREVPCFHLWGKDGSDDWGYQKGTESGHTPVWPMPKNDRDVILKNTGIDIL